MAIPEFRTCVPQVPSISFASGAGIFIDPNLPQSNSFSAYSPFPLVLPESVFTEAAKLTPPENFFAQILLPANQTDAFVTAYLQDHYPSAIRTQQVEHSTIQQIPNPAFDMDKARRDHPPYMVPETIPATRTVLQTTKMFGNLPFDEVVAKVKTDKVRPVVSRDFANNPVVQYVSAPVKQPRLFLVEEYQVAAYLGKYGLGRVVKTFSLLPGEKTTLTVKTYKDTTTTRTASENVLDSFTQTSANEFEKLIQAESTLNQQDSKTKTVGANLSLSLSPAKFIEKGSTAGGSFENKTINTRTSDTKNLNRALEKHVNTSNANRQMTVNTTTSETVKETEENSTVREVVNINKSRVLNFIFRQLHQQYITVTYLANVKVAFCNGYEESLRIVSLEELGDFLGTLIVEGQRATVEKLLLKNYCTVQNYKDVAIPFMERYSHPIGGCFPAGVSTLDGGTNPNERPANTTETVSYWRKKRAVQDSVPANVYGFPIEVSGAILSVQENTLKTSSVLVESLLGQADALDCFSMKIQDAEAQRGYQDLAERELRIQNENAKAQWELEQTRQKWDNENAKIQLELEHARQKWEAEQKYTQEYEQKKKETELDLMRLQVEIIRGLGDPNRQAEMYKRVFGNCCDTPQTVVQK